MNAYEITVCEHALRHGEPRSMRSCAVALAVGSYLSEHYHEHNADDVIDDYRFCAVSNIIYATPYVEEVEACVEVQFILSDKLREYIENFDNYVNVPPEKLLLLWPDLNHDQADMARNGDMPLLTGTARLLSEDDKPGDPERFYRGPLDDVQPISDEVRLCRCEPQGLDQLSQICLDCDTRLTAGDLKQSFYLCQCRRWQRTENGNFVLHGEIAVEAR